MILDPILQLTFKKLPLAYFGYSSKEDFSQLSEKMFKIFLSFLTPPPTHTHIPTLHMETLPENRVSPVSRQGKKPQIGLGLPTACAWYLPPNGATSQERWGRWGSGPPCQAFLGLEPGSCRSHRAAL